MPEIKLSLPELKRLVRLCRDRSAADPQVAALYERLDEELVQHVELERSRKLLRQRLDEAARRGR